tara:strand:+ start:2490 stop:3197 length:708 start_codon:yes stop_codon:yes gene_type:complete
VIVSIHQPNYLPWLGYFNKIARSDVFVIFDDVQFPVGKKGFFGNRNQIKTNSGQLWLTVPVLDRSKCKNFNEIEINYNGWNDKHVKNIENFYRKSEYFDVYYKDIESLLFQAEHYEDNFSKLSTELITYFMNVLDINTKIMYSSEICKDVDLTGMDKIFYILEQLKADTYISSDGAGSRRYIKEEDFSDKNIKLIWQNFEHPTYKQMYGDFISHLSIVDLLFNCGDKSMEIINGL